MLTSSTRAFSKSGSSIAALGQEPSSRKEDSMIDFHALQHCETCRMQEHLLTSRLTPALRQELNSLAFRVSLPGGSTVFQEGNEANGIFILRKGRTKVAMSSEFGRTVILYLAAPGELLGLSSVISGTPRQVSAITVEPCDLDLVRREDFLDFLNSHETQFRAALDELAQQHSCILNAIRRLSLAPSLLANLARFLLGLNCPEDKPQTDKIHLKHTQEEIAQQLGTTRESITRTLAKLRKEKVIEQRGRILTIRNRSLLEHIASARVDEAALKLA
jgi:CRP/FNR family transcriptional regulator